ncbi:DUF2267 domain-containing protein [Thermasporomyces composti]|jgi:uncharacterized protein (DUF2267 family)|uniref:Uncharacterized protein (DUF2267 family) n=1 Tax=Thermasporomyces composti TaxID=696763 RepID=A0A3D9V750_THECX|nr:DUF2267 domain-containing protein [Thermasporomyces composti]REF36000.1 uncharacterized protein (DUF2267 family) [Thermasporomyces composti]
MRARSHALARAEHTAYDWLTTVAQHLGTQDCDYAFRVVRAWLHAVRDRLTVEGAAHFAAQLPEILRGVFYDGWTPSRVPVKTDVEDFLRTFCQEAMISVEDAPKAVSAVSAAMRQMFSAGQLESALLQVPNHIARLLRPDGAAPTVPRARSSSVDDRLSEVERQLRGLTEAVRALSQKLEREREPAAASSIG